MKTKKITLKKSKIHFSKNGIAIIAGLTIFIVLAAAQFAYNRIMWTQLQRAETSNIKDLLIDAIEDISKDVPVEAKTGAPHIPEARLRLADGPMSFGTLRYNVYNGDAEKVSESSEINLVNTSTLRFGMVNIRGGQTIEDVFEAVPKAQACSRQIMLTFRASDHQNYTEQFNKKLADGRTVYVYLEKGCVDNATEVVDYLRAIQSY